MNLSNAKKSKTIQYVDAMVRDRDTNQAAAASYESFHTGASAMLVPENQIHLPRTSKAARDEGSSVLSITTKREHA